MVFLLGGGGGGGGGEGDITKSSLHSCAKISFSLALWML